MGASTRRSMGASTVSPDGAYGIRITLFPERPAEPLMSHGTT